MGQTWARNAGSFIEIDRAYARRAGVWREALGLWVRQGGSWQLCGALMTAVNTSGPLSRTCGYTPPSCCTRSETFTAIPVRGWPPFTYQWVQTGGTGGFVGGTTSVTVVAEPACSQGPTIIQFRCDVTDNSGNTVQSGVRTYTVNPQDVGP